jgi:hypothetical protein
VERFGRNQVKLDHRVELRGDEMKNKRHIVAPDGMVLTNGETFATELWLGDGDSAENWREITVEEAEKMQKEKEKEYEQQ